MRTSRSRSAPPRTATSRPLCAEVARHRDRHAERLELYLPPGEAGLPAPERLSGTALHQYLVLRGGIRVEEGFTQWCQEVLDAISPHAPEVT